MTADHSALEAQWRSHNCSFSRSGGAKQTLVTFLKGALCQGFVVAVVSVNQEAASQETNSVRSTIWQGSLGFKGATVIPWQALPPGGAAGEQLFKEFVLTTTVARVCPSFMRP